MDTNAGISVRDRARFFQQVEGARKQALQMPMVRRPAPLRRAIPIQNMLPPPTKLDRGAVAAGEPQLMNAAKRRQVFQQTKQPHRAFDLDYGGITDKPQQRLTTIQRRQIFENQHQQQQQPLHRAVVHNVSRPAEPQVHAPRKIIPVKSPQWQQQTFAPTAATRQRPEQRTLPQPQRQPALKTVARRREEFEQFSDGQKHREEILRTLMPHRRTRTAKEEELLQKEREEYAKMVAAQRRHSLEEKQKRMNRLKQLVRDKRNNRDSEYHTKLAKSHRAYALQREQLRNNVPAAQLRNSSAEESMAERMKFMRNQLERLPSDILHINVSVRDLARLLDPRRLHDKAQDRWRTPAMRTGVATVKDLTKILDTRVVMGR